MSVTVDKRLCDTIELSLESEILSPPAIRHNGGDFTACNCPSTPAMASLIFSSSAVAYGLYWYKA